MTIPEKSEFLAEECGIHFGDGYMKIRKDKWGTHYEYTIASHTYDDLNYRIYVKDLMKRLYGLGMSYERNYGNNCQLSYTVKELINFKLSAGMPLSPKNSLIIPEWIKENKKYCCAFLRGLFDTDGCLTFKSKNGNPHNYPIISVSSKNSELIDQISLLLNKLSFTFTTFKKQGITPKGTATIAWEIGISGRKNLENFIKLIGFNNFKHISKYQIWKRFGFCPPNTKIEQREKILSKQLDPYLLDKKIKNACGQI